MRNIGAQGFEIQELNQAVIEWKEQLENYLSEIFSNTSYGQIYISSPNLQALVAGTAAKIAGTTISKNLNSFTMPVSNKMQYIGGEKSLFKFSVDASFFISAQPRTIQLYIYKNGVAIAETQYINITTLDSFTPSINGIVELSTGDYLEVWCSSNNNCNLTMSRMILTITPLCEVTSVVPEF